VGGPSAEGAERVEFEEGCHLPNAGGENLSFSSLKRLR